MGLSIGRNAKLYMRPLAGIAVYASEHALVKRWVYPVERFWTYIPSPETERWCRFFGFGHEVTEPGVIKLSGPFGEKWLVHPSLMKHLDGHAYVDITNEVKAWPNNATCSGGESTGPSGRAESAACSPADR